MLKIVWMPSLYDFLAQQLFYDLWFHENGPLVVSMLRMYRFLSLHTPQSDLYRVGDSFSIYMHIFICAMFGENVLGVREGK